MSSNRLTSIIAIALVCLAVTMAATENIYAVPASPRIHTLTQMDGTTFKARQKGDEWFHFWQTVDGYTIVLDKITKNWMYATHDSEGSLVSSVNMVGKSLPPKEAHHLVPIGKTAKKLSFLKMAKASSLPTGKPLLQKNVVSNGPGLITGQMPVIMINFVDSTTTTGFADTSFNAADFNAKLFGTGNSTLKDYYDEVSYNNFTIDGAVVGWYNVAQNSAHYGAATTGTTILTSSGPVTFDEEDDLPGLLVEEAVILADLDPAFSFAPFDTDGDCYVDVVSIIHQGGGEQSTGNTNDIWSHSWKL